MKRIELHLIFLMLLVTAGTSDVMAQSMFQTGLTVNTQIVWNVIDSPEVPFSSFTGNQKWLAEEGSQMVFTIQEIGSEISGQVTLGNATWVTNQTSLARDLTIGVWGLTPFLPGLFVEIGESNIAALNATAYASAERVLGNYLNGTMESSFDNVTVGSTSYYCIVFEYIQDASGFGEPQNTTLAYDITTGVLIKCYIEYSFGTPYVLHLELASINPPLPIGWEIIAITGGIAALVFVLFVVRNRS